MDRLAGAAAVVVQADRVLLAQRRNPPDAGLWGYPGGHVEPGETVAETAIRELREETGVSARPLRILAELLLDTDPPFRLAMVQCAHLHGSPCAADDVSACEWVNVADVLSGDRPMSRDVDTVLRLALEAPS